MNTAHRFSISTAALLVGLGVSPALAQATVDNDHPVYKMQDTGTMNGNAESAELTASETARLERDEADTRHMDGQKMNYDERDDRDVTRTASENGEEFKDRNNKRDGADMSGHKEGWKHDQWNHDQWNHDQWDHDHWKHSGDGMKRAADTDDRKMRDRDFGQDRDGDKGHSTHNQSGSSDTIGNDRNFSHNQYGPEEGRDRNFGRDHDGDQDRDHFSTRQSGKMEMTGNEDHDRSGRLVDRDEDRSRDFDHKNDEHRTPSGQTGLEGDIDRDHMDGKTVTTTPTDLQQRKHNDGQNRRIYADSSAEVLSKDNDFGVEGRKDRDDGREVRLLSKDDADSDGMKIRRIKADDSALVDAGSSSSSTHASGEVSHGIHGKPHHLKAFTMTHMKGGHKPQVPHMEHSINVQQHVQPPHVTPNVTH